MDFIRSKKISLIDVLSTEASFILQHVESKGLITRREYLSLQSMSQNGERTAIGLLDKLMNKGDQRCKTFIALLREKEVRDNIPRLEEVFTPQQATTSEQVIQSPEQDDPAQETSSNKVYKMTHSPHGRCIIINNVNFRTSSTRKGSNEDADALKEVFEWLDFTVECYTDLTKEEMKTIVQECSQTADGDCFVCCVLSHGQTLGVLGCDDEVLPIEDILTPLKGHNCPKLAGKPKLFFIQACRGKRFQDYTKIHTDTHEDDYQGLAMDAGPGEMISIPADADFLVSMSTVDKYYSIRHCSTGSWFIQALCKQLKEGTLRGDDILTILTHVNDDVCREEGHISGKKAKQVPDQSFRLRKRLVFPVPNPNSLDL